MSSILSRFLPKETSFFEFFEQHCAHTAEACRKLIAMTEAGADVPSLVARIRQLEHDSDAVTHLCIRELQKTFITPFDRLHIHKLIRRLDDVADCIEEASSVINLHEIREMRPEIRSLGEILYNAIIAVSQGVTLLRDLKNEEEIKKICITIHRLENEGDQALRAAIKRLFSENAGPLDVIKWKEIFEHLERAVDRCEDVADIIQGVILEAS